jgi:multicomponent K+:H+ antiporter subunit A
MVALIFVGFSAPDLALTQLSVEIVTIVLLLLALYFLPQHSTVIESRARLWRDGILAVVAGSAASLLAWAVMTRTYETISGFFLENSIPGGGGSNVVNVILVDFRGYDTLGEITVLALAALGISAMLQGLQLNAPDCDAQKRPWDHDAHPSIMATLSRILLPFALLVAVFILLRGHNQPGGGFIAGLIAVVAIILQYLANGTYWMHQRFKYEVSPLLAWGLGIAALTGIASGLFNYPFLTSTFSHVHIPLIGEIELASAMAFDLGVFLVVLGSILIILVQLGFLHRANPVLGRFEARSWKD